MSERPIDAYDAEYNASIPADWWTSDEWRPTKWAYGPLEAGHGNFDENPVTPVYANNAYMMIQYFKRAGWCFQSICALLGNVQGEGAFNPGDWERWGDPSRGFGLVQWTPGTGYFNQAERLWGADDPWAPYYYSGWYECYMLALEALHLPSPNPRQWVPVRQGASPVYPGERPDRDYLLSFKEWAVGDIPDPDVTTITQRVQYLSSAFYWCYEQVGMYIQDGTESQRAARSLTWYNRFRLIFPDFTSSAVKENPYKPGPYTTLGNIIHPPWWYKAVYNANRKGGALREYAR